MAKQIADTEKVKIKIPLDPEAHFGCSAEWVWADPLPDNLYRIDSVPFFSEAVDLGDIVECQPDETEEASEAVPVLSRIVRATAGWSLFVRLADRQESQGKTELLDWLSAHQVAYEGIEGHWVILRIPADEVDIKVVEARLQEAKQAGVLEYVSHSEYDPGSESEVEMPDVAP